MSTTEKQPWNARDVHVKGKLTDLYILAAIKVFYDQNKISVDIELFKLANVTSPAGSDLSLAKHLIATFNGSCHRRYTSSRVFNSIDLRDLFARCEATFPSLQSMVVHTDGTTLPSTSLFDIYLDCHRLPAIISNVDFSNVGCFVASTRLEHLVTFTVKYKELAELWHEITELSFSSRMRALNGFAFTDESLENEAHQAFLTKMVFENSGDDFTQWRMDNFRTNMGWRYNSTSRKHLTLNLNDNAYWTHLACLYRAYRHD